MWIIRSLCDRYPLVGDGELPAIARGIVEQRWQAIAHACHLRLLIDVAVHARDMRLKKRSKVRRVGFSGCLDAAMYLLDRPPELSVPVEEGRIPAHVGRSCATHHSAAHHS